MTLVGMIPAIAVAGFVLIVSVALRADRRRIAIYRAAKGNGVSDQVAVAPNSDHG